MAIIKVVNVKRTPLKNLKYIANDEKTLNGTLITGINCSNDIYKANEKMENINRNYGKKNEVKLKHRKHSIAILTLIYNLYNFKSKTSN